MAEEEDEGTNIAAFMSAFIGAGFANPAGTKARLKAERRAGLTPKQRQRMSEPKKQVNFRASQETRARLARLAAHLDVSTTAVLLMAIEKLAASTPGFEDKS